jgi:hypothetical protein
MKAYAIGRRGEYKDYIDMYYILSEQHVSLGEVLQMAKEKFKENFNDRLFLEQLLYLEDIKDAGIVFLKEKKARLN